VTGGVACRALAYTWLERTYWKVSHRRAREVFMLDKWRTRGAALP
jgi:hypothetical protein